MASCQLVPWRNGVTLGYCPLIGDTQACLGSADNLELDFIQSSAVAFGDESNCHFLATPLVHNPPVGRQRNRLACSRAGDGASEEVVRHFLTWEIRKEGPKPTSHPIDQFSTKSGEIILQGDPVLGGELDSTFQYSD
jgi:hypothetical protein